MADFLQQLAEQKRKVDFNTYDMTTKELVSLVADGTINISPEYQRQFRWEEERQSSLIESIFLGIPVPSLFMATNMLMCDWSCPSAGICRWNGSVFGVCAGGEERSETSLLLAVYE